MTLSPGTHVGPYEVLGPLGAGGMGEVYRARDTKLHREVALKILPAAFAADPDRRVRFTREAHVLASLNHPHVAAIYGFEEGGGVGALVLELIEGPTLADRLEAAGPGGLPLAEALQIAAQIADALEAAHEKGIVHRDLKPSNIKVTDDGRVKVLDFGLAKALDSESASLSVEGDLSPTMTAAASRLGVVVGTAAYMSPEQTKGRPVDKRADIWAFGCVLYEMLAGQRAFTGEDATDLVVAIVTKDPDWSRLPPSTPLRIVELLQRCVKKDPRERLRDVGDARMEIDDARRGARHDAIAPARARRLPFATIVLGSAAVGASLVLAVTRLGQRAEPPRAAPLPLVRTSIELPANAQLALGTQIPLQGYDSPIVALSPDGRRLVYVGQAASGTMLYQRELGGAATSAIPGTEGAIYAFFSPDSRWVGFLTNHKVKKASVEGGTPVTLCDAVVPVSASWLGNDTIYFGEDEGARVSRISAAGGRSEVALANRAGARMVFSQALPDGRAVLATAWVQGISADYADVLAISLADGTSKAILHSAYDARYVEPGYLVFGRSGNLFAVRFDSATRTISGEPMLVASGVGMESLFGQVHATASANGVLAYAMGGDRAVGRLAWVDRRGATEFLPAPPALYGVVDLSADGSRLAVHVADVTDNIWVYDFKRAEGRRLATSDHSGWPVWSPDATRIAFSTWRSSAESEIAVRTVDGGSAPEIVARSDRLFLDPSTWSPDGRVLAVNAFVTGTPAFRAFVLGQAGKAENGNVREWPGNMPYFSPDGRWLALAHGPAGPEIAVQSYPDARTVRQISVAGGIEPLWCRCGELFYRNGNRWMSVRIRTTPELAWDPPQAAFQTDFIDTPGRSYAVSPDGKRLLVVKAAEPDVRNRINVVTNWTEALKR